MKKILIFLIIYSLLMASTALGKEKEKNLNNNKYKIPIGHIIQGVLDMEAISDYVGPWKGKLSQPILSIDKQVILFPKGSIVTGKTVKVTGENEAIHNRLAFLPLYIVQPNGEAFKIDNQAILDQVGVGALKDEVDYHLATQLAALGAFTAVETVPEIIIGNLTSKSSMTNNVLGSLAEKTEVVGKEIISKYLKLIPTIKIRSGIPFTIFIQEEIFVDKWRKRSRFKFSNIGEIK